MFRKSSLVILLSICSFAVCFADEPVSEPSYPDNPEDVYRNFHDCFRWAKYAEASEYLDATYFEAQRESSIMMIKSYGPNEQVTDSTTAADHFGFNHQEVDFDTLSSKELWVAGSKILDILSISFMKPPYADEAKIVNSQIIDDTLAVVEYLSKELLKHENNQSITSEKLKNENLKLIEGKWKIVSIPTKK